MMITLRGGCVTGDNSFEHDCFPIQIEYLTTVLGRILFSSVVMVMAFRPGVPGSKPAQILYFCHACIRLFFVTDFDRKIILRILD